MSFETPPKIVNPENKAMNDALSKVLEIANLSPEEIKALEIPSYVADQLERISEKLR